MSYLSQMAGLAWHNFISAAAGIAIAVALARGLTRRGEGRVRARSATSGSTSRGRRSTSSCRSRIVFALVLVSQGVIQNFSPYAEVTTLDGAKQVIAMGPVASQEAIKQLGTNGGGFFNANTAHPFENPTPFTQLLSMFLIFAIPAALTFMFGRMARDQRQGWALFGAMALLFFAGVTAAYWAEAPGNPIARRPRRLAGPRATWRARRSASASPNSALYATVTTAASCGAVNAMHDSFTPLGGLVPLFNIQLGEVVFGGVGAGLYGMLVMAILVGVHRRAHGGPHARVPRQEDRDARGEARDALRPDLPAGDPRLRGVGRRVAPYGLSSLNNAGPHGLSEILYAFIERRGQQRLRLRRTQRQHALLQLALGHRRCSSGASG